jgi:hypothetical protein
MRRSEGMHDHDAGTLMQKIAMHERGQGLVPSGLIRNLRRILHAYTLAADLGLSPEASFQTKKFAGHVHPSARLVALVGATSLRLTTYPI